MTRNEFLMTQKVLANRVDSIHKLEIFFIKNLTVNCDGNVSRYLTV